MFYTYRNDFFIFLEEIEIYKYTDETIIYAHGRNVDNFTAHSENDALKIIECFPNNLMKLNEDECHLLIFDTKDIEVSIQIGGTGRLKESKEENPLCINFDRSLSFEQHVKFYVRTLAKNFML